MSKPSPLRRWTWRPDRWSAPVPARATTTSFQNSRNPLLPPSDPVSISPGLAPARGQWGQRFNLCSTFGRFCMCVCVWVCVWIDCCVMNPCCYVFMVAITMIVTMITVMMVTMTMTTTTTTTTTTWWWWWWWWRWWRCLFKVRARPRAGWGM